MVLLTQQFVLQGESNGWEEKNFFKSYFFYRFSHDPIAVISFIILFVILLAAIFAPLVSPHKPFETTSYYMVPPAGNELAVDGFILGTDDQGRDLLTSILYGLRTSILIGLGAVVLQAALGIVFGLLAGYSRKWVDSFIMRLADVQLSFSSYMVAIFIMAFLQSSKAGIEMMNTIALPVIILIIGVSEWPQYARTVRASVLAEKKKEYVEAAQVIGLKPVQIMGRHIFPNTLTPVLVISCVQVANAIMSEAALSFLGWGMPPTVPSLGTLIKNGFNYVNSGDYWVLLYPSIALVLLVLAINLLGDWLRDYLNPKLYKD